MMTRNTISIRAPAFLIQLVTEGKITPGSLGTGGDHYFLEPVKQFMCVYDENELTRLDILEAWWASRKYAPSLED